MEEFKRVDFNNPSTIMSYGDEIKEEISKILYTATINAAESEEIVISEEKINSIVSFDETIKKEQNGNKLLTTLKGALKKVGIKTPEKKETISYKEKYVEYCELIEEVCTALKSQMQGSLNDIKTRETLINTLTPYIEKLEYVINIGEEDAKDFQIKVDNNKVIALEEELKNIEYQENLLNLFRGKLESLKNALITFKETIYMYRIQQKTDMESVMLADSYIRDQAPMLKIQGSSLVYNHNQQRRLETMKALNNATNEAFKKNAKTLEQNINTVVELSMNNGVSTENLLLLNESIQKGLKTYKEGIKRIQTKNQNEKTALDKLNASLNGYNQEIAELTSNNEEDVVKKLTFNNK